MTSSSEHLQYTQYMRTHTMLASRTPHTLPHSTWRLIPLIQRSWCPATPLSVTALRLSSTQLTAGISHAPDHTHTQALHASHMYWHSTGRIAYTYAARCMITLVSAMGETRIRWCILRREWTIHAGRCCATSWLAQWCCTSLEFHRSLPTCGEERL